MMWSMACIAKLNVMNSTTGRRPAKAAPTPKACKAVFGDGRIDDPFVAELFQQSAGDLGSPWILTDLFAHQEDPGIPPHFLSQSIPKGVAHSDAPHRAVLRRVAGDDGRSDGLGSPRGEGLGEDGAVSGGCEGAERIGASGCARPGCDP
jgi:hypothetical protein